MFRFNVVAVLCLGLLVSCGPEEPERLAPEEPSQAGESLTVAQAQLQVSPGTLDFGKQKTGTSSVSRVVTVSNTGDTALSITALSLSGPFAVSPSTAFTLAPGATQQLAVTFSPPMQGPSTGTLTLSTNDPANPQVTVALAGTGVAFTADVSPSSLNFGQQRVGTTSAALSVTVSNTGSSSLQVTDVFANGPYSVSPSTPFTLAPGASQTLSVRFSPDVEGLVTGTNLTLYTSAPDRPIINVGLTGAGVSPMLELVPSALAFGEQPVNTTSMARTVTVKNNGSGPIQITSVSVSGAPFTVSPSTSFMLAANQSKVLSVTFSPTVEGAATGTLTLSTDYAPQSTATVSLSGVGVKPKLMLSSSALAFEGQRVGTTSAPKTVTVGNTGTGGLRITSVLTTGPFSVTPNVEFELPSHAYRDLSVTFHATVEGSATGTLTLSTNDPDFPSVTIPLTGTGVQPPVVSLSNSSLAFGEQRVGTTSGLFLTVSNTGGSTLLVSEVFTNGPFSVSPSAPFTLAPSGIQSLVVKFTPTSEGASAGNLTLNTNDPARPTVTVSLTGTGVKPALALSATSLAFGEQRVGTASTALTVTVSNTGSGPIHVANLSVSGPFSLFMAPVLPFALVPNASQTLQVTFSPTIEGAATGTLTLATTDPDWPSVTVALMGTGVQQQQQQPSLALSATSLAFGEQRVGTASTPKTVTVSNTGSNLLRITSVSIGAGEPFAVTPSTAFDLAAGASRELVVTFSPTTQGVATGTLTLTSDDPRAPSAAVSLTGTGVKASLALSPASLDFGEKTVGSTSGPKTVTVLNTGTSPLRITSVATGTGEPFAVSPSEPFTLAPQESQALAVTFGPTAGGNVTGTLTLTTDDADKPIITVALTGTGREVESLPGGSCGATEGGSAGMLALLLLAGLGSRRRRHPHGTYGF